MKRAAHSAYLTLVLGLLLLPEYAFGQGLVPECTRGGDPTANPCQFCDVVVLVNNVVGWLVSILGVIGTIVIVYAGVQLVVSGGNVGAKEKAKTLITNILIGYILVLAGWLIINTGLRALLNDDGFGVWNEIECVSQPRAIEATQSFVNVGRIDHPTIDASRGTAYTTASVQGMSDAELQALARSVANLSASEADALIAETASRLGIADQTRNIQALMRVESGGCRNNVSPVGALGCMQIMPNTARQYDPALRNLSDAQVRQRLLDPSYNIPLGVQIYQDLYTVNGGDTTRTFAGYNGGQGANNPSRDCPGQMRWECQWDNSAQTVPNTGYIETRNYVRKVAETANNLP